MNNDFNSARVSIILLRPAELAYASEDFTACVAAALEQDHPSCEVIVADRRGAAASVDFAPPNSPADSLRHVAGAYANRAALCNAAIQAAAGDFVLLLLTEQAAVHLRRSAVQSFVMAAMRHADAAMVYADYERVTPTGERRDVHLLDWHEGRLRETVDFGSAILFRTATLREVGVFNERYMAADLYDLRLRMTERWGAAHIANRYAGSLYTVASPAKAHNVFDYLLAGRNTQLEFEHVCTEHLKRTGAYLEPGAHFRRVPGFSVDDGSILPRPLPKREGGKAHAAGDVFIASIVTPVNRRPGFIGRAIESVQAQTEPRVEMIVVVNGGPDDPTADEVRRYMPGGDRFDAGKPPVRLIVVDVNNLGLCLNSGIAAARGRVYVQLDSDDRLKPDAVEKLLAVFDSDATIGMVIGSYEVWTLDEATGELRRNEEIPVVTHAEWTAENGRNNLLRINGAGAPRAADIRVIREAGWFGVNDTPRCRNYGEDYDLVLRISERYAIGRVWEPIYEVIRHSGGTDHSIDQATIDRNDEAKDFMRLEALRRRRFLQRQDAETPR